jgi:murein DD-endopeptidase MepM/ murein hydrolase activator NlpD
MISKFKYDHENLRYLRLNQNFRGKFLKAFIWLMGTMFLAIVFNVLYASFFDTPAERQVRQENKALSEYFDMLNRKFVKIDTVLREVRKIDENLYRTIFETEPAFRQGDEKNNNEYLELINTDNRNLVGSTADDLQLIMKNIDDNTEDYAELLKLSSANSEKLFCLPAIQPIRNSDLTRLAAGFGIKLHPHYKIRKFHYGMDFIAPTGTEVFATGGGVIQELEWTRRGNGNTIVIDHGNGYKTVYSYLDNFNVKKGKHVKRGDVIGWVGNTELSVAPHLHYEVYLNGKPVNPVNYFFLELDPREYNRAILLASKSGQSFD